jgi:cyclic-di-GMP-binding protein
MLHPAVSLLTERKRRGGGGPVPTPKLYNGRDKPLDHGVPMPSFDIVSKLDLAEVDNALAGLTREISTRFDFKDSKSSVKRTEGALTILADDELKLRQVQELLRMHVVRRKVDPGALDFKDAEKAAGQSVRQTVALRQGIDQELAKRIVRAIKDSKLKVQTAIQGDELRVSGKKRDDLQDAIALVRGLKLEQPLQYVNFRD